MQGKFNILQRTMLHWNDLHPYNVVEVVRFQGADVERLRAVIHATLKQRGLTGFMLDAERKTFAYTGEDVAYEFQVLKGKGNGNLMVEIERQLNTPFASHGSFSPFRFFRRARG